MSTTILPHIFVGIDWGSEFHQACVVNADGETLGEKSFPHSGDGLSELQKWIMELADCGAESIAVAIEVPHGPVVDSLMECGVQVNSINPKQLDRFRDRFSPSGAKDDRRDAHVLADALRTDPQCLRKLEVMDPEIIQLREWSRMSEEYTAERTRVVHQIRQQLWRYFPQFLRLGFDLNAPVIRSLWKLIPTPARARRVRLSSVEKILKEHRIRRITAEKVLTTLRSTPISVADGAEPAITKNLHLRFKLLGVIEANLCEAKQAMEAILKELSAPNPSGQTDSVSEDELTRSVERHNDVNILSSMPGIGTTVLSVLLSEASPLLKERDYQALRVLTGVAPTTLQSGKSCRVIRRRACHWRLSNAVYHWSRVAVQHDPVSKAKYKALRARGQTHGRALRSVGDRLLAVACAMLRTGQLFNPSRVLVEA